jgi:glycosyltransferase involved in cell wall biosynthesis
VIDDSKVATRHLSSSVRSKPVGEDNLVTILQISRVDFFGGVERMIVNIIQANGDETFRSIIALPGDGELAAVARSFQIDTATMPIARGRAPKSPMELVGTLSQFLSGRNAIWRFARDRAIGLIHTHHPVTAFQAIKAARRGGIPLLLHVHETLPVPASYALAMKRVLKHVDHFVCVSRKSHELVESYGVPAHKISLVYNGLDDAAFRPHAPAGDINGPGPHIGIFGVIEPRKGHDVFLQACRRIAINHPTAQFWIFGAVSFSDKEDFADRVRALATGPALDGHVHFAGHRSDVPALMCAMDVVVSASIGFESLPTVLLEASAQGRPIVATDVGGVREIVEDGRTGWVVPPGNAGALADAIDSALGAKGAEMGRAARKSAITRFSLDRFGLEIGKIYGQALGHGARAA